MNAFLFNKFCRIARQNGGIAIRQGKEALVAARVAKRQRVLGLATARKYLRYLEADETGAELVHFLDVISTNFTSFFREADHFRLLGEVLNRLVKRGQRRFRLWSAAGATGEEAYSMAMTALEVLDGESVDLKILATDLSTRALEVAQTGVYPAARLQPLTRVQRQRFCTRTVPDSNGRPQYQINPEVQRLVVFKRLNLARPPFPMRGPLDMVFCRNAMIYFDPATRQRLIGEVQRLLGPARHLVVGHAETLTGVHHSLEMISASVYRRRVLERRDDSRASAGQIA